MAYNSKETANPLKYLATLIYGILGSILSLLLLV